MADPGCMLVDFILLGWKSLETLTNPSLSFYQEKKVFFAIPTKVPSKSSWQTGAKTCKMAVIYLCMRRGFLNYFLRF